MPEEKQGFFDDMPSEEKKKDDASEMPGEPEEKEKREEEIRKLSIAGKQEDKRLAKAKADLAEKRKARKALKDEEEGEEPEEEEEIAEEDKKKEEVRSAINTALKERDEEERRRVLALKIRSIAKSRQEAERIYEEALKLPSTGDLDFDVKLSADRVQALRERGRSFVLPSASGSGGFDDYDKNPDEEVPGFSKERVEFLEKRGFTKKQIKDFANGPDLARVWGEGKVLINNR